MMIIIIIIIIVSSQKCVISHSPKKYKMIFFKLTLFKNVSILMTIDSCMHLVY